MNVKIIDSAEEIAKIVSDRIISLVKEKPDCILGLATGSTPLQTYQKVIEKAKKQNVSFLKVRTFNLDEYLDNPIKEQSYRYFMDENLFDKIDIKKENTHFPPFENPAAYDEEILSCGGIDLQILGIGRDGHIAFNEPGTPFDSMTHIASLDEKTIKDNSRFFESIDQVPKKAVTMGLATIMKAKEIILIATGKNKAEAIYKMTQGLDTKTPASILNKHNNTTVYIDNDIRKEIESWKQ